MKTRLSQSFRFVLTFSFALGASGAAQAAAPIITNITMVGATPQFGVQSDLGVTNQVQYCPNLSQTNWVVLTNLLVAQSPYWFVDVAAPSASQRFYRLVALPASTPPPSDMVLIPAGSFTMGNCMDPGEGTTDELPLHTVYVSAFYMDKYEVTKALWDEVKAWNGGNGYSYENAGSAKATTHPVQSVNWRDCVKWCNARSQKEALTPCYYNEAELTTVYNTETNTPYAKWDANGYRLPTEAEWEKAARGGASGHRFPWSNVDTITHSRANYWVYQLSGTNYYVYDKDPTEGYHLTFNDGITPYTSPVGYFAANGYGLYDMAGNVWEWCWDWYSSTYYSSSPGTEPRGPASPSPYSVHVLRGGSWYYVAGGSRCAKRTYYNPAFAFNNLGFRCVRGF
jgi:formylglycine-generating enzyme